MSSLRQANDHVTHQKHYLLFAFFYVAIPAMLAWLGYVYYSIDNSTHKIEQERNAKQAAAAPNSKTGWFDLPQMTPSIVLGPEKTGTLKMDLSLEVSQTDLLRIADFEPRIMERIALYMQDKTFDDHHNFANLNAVRQGLEREIRRGAFPVPVIDVVIKEMALE